MFLANYKKLSKTRTHDQIDVDLYRVPFIEYSDGNNGDGGDNVVLLLLWLLLLRESFVSVHRIDTRDIDILRLSSVP